MIIHALFQLVFYILNLALTQLKAVEDIRDWKWLMFFEFQCRRDGGSIRSVAGVGGGDERDTAAAASGY